MADWRMGLPQAVHYYTPDEYYRLEREAAYKSEYLNGEIFPMEGVFGMAGGSANHSLIKANLLRELGNRLKGKPCAAYDSDLRLKVQASGLRVYPDASIYCGRLEYDEEDNQKHTSTNPTVLFEVLSDSTEAYDRGAKASQYRSIVSLQSYVLVSQHEAHIEHYARGLDGTWLLTEAKGMNAVISLPEVGISIALEEVYDRIDFASTVPLRIVTPA